MNRNRFLSAALFAVLATSAPGALQFVNVSRPDFTSTLNAVACDNQLTFFAVGQSTFGLGATFDLSAWATNTVVTNALGDGSLSAIAYGDGTFVAGGINASTFYSFDHVNWFRGSKANSSSVTVSGLAQHPSLGRFAAVGLFPLASWSTDVATSWTPGALTAPVSPFFSFRGLTAFGANSFATCGDSGTIRISNNGGASWTESNPRANFGDVDLRAIASDLALQAGGGGESAAPTSQGGVVVQELVSVGLSGRVMYSQDGGLSWKTNNWITANVAGANLNGVAYMNPGYIVVGDGGRVFTITDITGTNWTVHTSTATTANLLGVAFATSGTLRGVATLVGTGGTIVISGTPPPPPTAVVASTTKCAFDANQTSSVSLVTDTLHPPGTLTVVWYDANGALVTNNAVNPTDFILITNVAGTYTNFAKARDLRTGIVSEGQGTPVVSTVNPLPPPPTNTTVVGTNCAGFGNGPLTVQVVNGALASWFNEQGTLLETGTLTHIPTNTTAGTYTNFVQAYFVATGCFNTNRTPVAFTINPPPPPPTNTTSPVAATNNCAGSGNNPLTVNVTAGASADWYNAQGTLVQSGTLNYTPTNTAPGRYTNFAQAYFVATGCINTNRTPVAFTINPLPVVTALTGTQTNCYGIVSAITATLGGTAGPWNVVWSDGFPQNGVTSPVSRFVSPAIGVTNYSVTSLVDAATGCVAPVTNLAAFSVALTVEDCSAPLTIQQLNAGNVVVGWYGNLRLLRAPNLEPPTLWSLMVTGSPGKLNRWTNPVVPPPPNYFFRLTNAP